MEHKHHLYNESWVGIQSLYRLSSDEVQQNLCEPCAKTNRDVPAKKFCINCSENICLLCSIDHRKFSSMENHVIIPEDLPKAELPKTTCVKHENRLVDCYCPADDKIGCITCIEQEHSSCPKLDFIPTMVRKTNKLAELADVENSVDILLTELDNLQEEKQTRRKVLNREKVQLLKKVKNFRKKIDVYFDEMEKGIINKIDSLFLTKFEAVDNLLKQISSLIEELRETQKSIFDAYPINQAEEFVQKTKGKTQIEKSTEDFKNISSTDDGRFIKFYPDSRFKRLIEENNSSLGEILEFDPSIDHLDVLDCNVRLPSDKQPCAIHDFCQIASGHIILTDGGNSRIKELNHSYDVIAYLDLPGEPSCICTIDETKLAVTLITLEQVQLISCDQWSLEKSFAVSNLCRGIDCRNKLLYVCCGGRSADGTGDGYVEVFDLNGNKLKTLCEGKSIPIRIASSMLGFYMFINMSGTNRKDIVRLDVFGNCVSPIRINGISKPVGFGMIGDGRFVVAGYETNNIVLTSDDGTVQNEILTVEDGIVKPIAVCFDHKRKRLLVSLYNSDIIKVGKIHR